MGVFGGFGAGIEKEKWSQFESLLLELMRSFYVDVLEKIRGGVLNAKIKTKLREIVKDSKQEFGLIKEKQ